MGIVIHSRCINDHLERNRKIKKQQAKAYCTTQNLKKLYHKSKQRSNPLSAGISLPALMRQANKEIKEVFQWM